MRRRLDSITIALTDQLPMSSPMIRCAIASLVMVVDQRPRRRVDDADHLAFGIAVDALGLDAHHLRLHAQLLVHDAGRDRQRDAGAERLRELLEELREA